jgi:hypothetical protein
MYQDFIEGHPGNRFFNSLVTRTAYYARSYNEVFEERTASYVLEAVKENHGRFLYQSASGEWQWFTDEKALNHITRQLELNANPALIKLAKAIRHLSSEYMYGFLRQTILAQKHAVPFLRSLESRVLGVTTIDRSQHKPSDQPVGLFVPFRPLSILQKLPSDKSVLPKRQALPTRNAHSPPAGEPWIVIGQEVEHRLREGWYVGLVASVNAHGDVRIAYPAADSVMVKNSDIRPFVPYEEGEEVEVLDYDGEYHLASIAAANDDGTFDVELMDDDGTYYEDVSKFDLRRRPRRIFIIPIEEDD